MITNLFSDCSSWIWLDRVADQNCYLEFATEFQASGKGAVLYLTAEGQYVALLDGVWLPSTQYPDFPHRKSVQRIELPVLNEGNHTLQIQVHYDGIDTSVVRKELPGLRFELRQGDKLLTASGEETLARPLAGYTSGPIPVITGQLGVGFYWADLPAEPWQRAKVVKKACVFAPRPIPELSVSPLHPGRLYSQGVFTSHESDRQQYAALSYRMWDQLTDVPQEDLTGGNGIRFRSQEGDGIYLVLDLGQESVGYLDIDAVCPETTRVDIGFGEHLEDLRVRTDVGGRCFTVRWEAGPQRKRFVHRFLRLGGRYLQLYFHSHDVTFYHAGLQMVNYPVRGLAEFKSSDKLMDKIFQVSVHTLRCSMHEHYEDCPWREQALYAFDSRNQMLSGYYAFGEFTQPRESLRTLALSLREDGLLELCAPGRVSVDIPSFSLVFVTALEEYCRYSGDVEFAREMLPVVRTILETFHGHMKDGLMREFPGYWNFYEWRPYLSGYNGFESEGSCPLQMFYLLALQRMERICRYLHLDAPGLAEEIRMVTEGLEAFWDEDCGAYASYLREGEKTQYAQLVQSLALYTNACPEPRRAELCRKLLADELVPVSLAYSIFKYDALMIHARERAEEIFDQIAERWGNMLWKGATTFWETDEGAPDFGRAGSLCHGWSGIPTYLFGAYVLGVRPEEPGEWKIHEEAGILHYAEGALLTPQGELKVIKHK